MLLPKLHHNSRRVDMPTFTKPWIAAIPGQKYYELQNEAVSKEHHQVVQRLKEWRP